MEEITHEENHTLSSANSMDKLVFAGYCRKQMPWVFSCKYQIEWNEITYISELSFSKEKSCNFLYSNLCTLYHVINLMMKQSANVFKKNYMIHSIFSLNVHFYEYNVNFSDVSITSDLLGLASLPSNCLIGLQDINPFVTKSAPVPVPGFPDGLNDTSARQLCEENYNTSVAASVCKDIITLSVDDLLNACVENIRVSLKVFISFY